jgi:hypothetical protein
MLLIPGEELKCFDRSENYVRAVFSSGDQRYENRFFLLEIGEFDQIKLPRAGLGVSLDYPGENRVAVSVETDFFAQDVTLTVQDTDVFYTDNMFHLDAHGRKTVTLTFTGEGYAGKRL